MVRPINRYRRQSSAAFCPTTPPSFVTQRAARTCRCPPRPQRPARCTSTLSVPWWSTVAACPLLRVRNSVFATHDRASGLVDNAGVGLGGPVRLGFFLALTLTKILQGLQVVTQEKGSTFFVCCLKKKVLHAGHAFHPAFHPAFHVCFIAFKLRNTP